MDPSQPPEITSEMLAENPLLLLGLSLLSLVVIAFLAGAVTSWVVIGYRWWHGQPLMEIEPWKPRVWGLADLVVTVLLLLTMQGVLGNLGVALLDVDAEAMRAGEDPPLSLSAFISASYLFGVMLAIGWILLRYRADLSQVGLTQPNTLKKLGIGLLAGFAALPVVYVLSAVVNFGFDATYEHPILDEMREDGTFTGFLLAVFAAVFVAPLAEEIFFRVLIQGWLQSIPFSRLAAILLGASEQQRSDPLQGAYYYPVAKRPAEEMSPTDASSQEPRPEEVWHERDPGGDPVLPASALKPPIWPSLVTGTLFGLAHWGYGLSFIPLIVLGIVLGLLYRGTQSVWPCVAVHFMLNASSLLVLGVNVLVEQAQS